MSHRNRLHLLNAGFSKALLLRWVVVVFVMMSVSGCASLQNQSIVQNTIIDQPLGDNNYNLDSSLILITVTPEYHTKMSLLDEEQSDGDIPPGYAQFLERMKTQYGLERVADWPLTSINVYCIVFETKTPELQDSLVASLSLESSIETAQPVQSFGVQASRYNDPFLSLQHGLFSLQALVSHRWSRGEGVRIAVVDTGSDVSHPELETQTELTRNFVDRDEQKFRSDIHGTAVGGIIVATANNETGMVGVAPEAKLLALKACWQSDDVDTGAKCNSVTLALALNFSILEDVDIINLSLTGPRDPLLERLVSAALTKNIIVVGAKPSHDKPAFPISVEGTIAVSMPNSDSRTLSAPGQRVLSTSPGREYDFYDGSSFSTAHISGLAAVIRSLSPMLSPSDLLAVLKRTADPASGAVNACRAVAEVRRLDSESVDVKGC